MLSESPVFQAMKDAGETSGNPFVESFTYPGNKKRIFVALFGITGILTTIWYTAFFSGMSFLRGPMHLDALTVEVILLIAGGIAMSFYVFVGKWSDYCVCVFLANAPVSEAGLKPLEGGEPSERLW